MSNFNKAKLGQVLDNAKHNFEVNHKANGSELDLTVIRFNNFWNIINNTNHNNKTEALRSSLL